MTFCPRLAAFRMIVSTAIGFSIAAFISPSPTEGSDDHLSEAKTVQKKTIAIADDIVAATVGVTSRQGPGQRGLRGMGSGVIVSKEGLVLSAAHVTRMAGKNLTVILSDGRKVDAIALGANDQADVGMAKITTKGQYPFVKVGKSSSIEIGDWCLAVGHPLGVQRGRSAPIRLGRVLRKPGKAGTRTFIGTDATVISGDSGGPLFNLDGEVIGINSNIGLDLKMNNHAAVDAFHANWDELLSGKNIGSARFGSDARRNNGTPTDTRRAVFGIHLSRNNDAAMIAAVSPGGAAEKAGLKGGDTILTIDGNAIKGREDLVRVIGSAMPGQKIKIEYRRDQETRMTTATLQNRAGETPALKTPDEKQSDEPKEKKADEKTKSILQQPGAIERLRQATQRLIGDSRESKTNRELLDDFDSATRDFSKSIVEFRRDGKPVIQGIVWRVDGIIITKSSEIEGDEICQLGGEDYEIRGITRNEEHDLALIRIDAEELTPLRWEETEVPLGTWVITPNAQGEAVALGIVGVPTRKIPAPHPSMRQRNKAMIGISLDMNQDRPIINGLAPQGPAEKAGLKSGDVIISVNKKETPTRESLISTLGKYKAGQKVILRYERDDEQKQTIITLILSNQLRGPMGRAGMTPQQMMSGGKKASKRAGNFPNAFTHDCTIGAEQCGGPLLNLDGKAVGINIARANRTATYAIPVDVLQKTIAKMIPKIDKEETGSVNDDL